MHRQLKAAFASRGNCILSDFPFFLWAGLRFIPREICRNNAITKPRGILNTTSSGTVHDRDLFRASALLCIVDIMRDNDDYFIHPLRQKTRDDSPQRSFEYPFYDIFSGRCGWIAFFYSVICNTDLGACMYGRSRRDWWKILHKEIMEEEEINRNERRWKNQMNLGEQNDWTFCQKNRLVVRKNPNWDLWYFISTVFLSINAILLGGKKRMISIGNSRLLIHLHWRIIVFALSIIAVQKFSVTRSLIV